MSFHSYSTRFQMRMHYFVRFPCASICHIIQIFNTFQKATTVSVRSCSDRTLTRSNLSSTSFTFTLEYFFCSRLLP